MSWRLGSLGVELTRYSKSASDATNAESDLPPPTATATAAWDWAGINRTVYEPPQVAFSRVDIRPKDFEKHLSKLLAQQASITDFWFKLMKVNRQSRRSNFLLAA